MCSLKSIVVLLIATSVTHGKLPILSHKPPPININVRAKAATEHYIKQRVDNFNPSDMRTWNMKYYSNGQFFQDQGPVIIYLGGEWDIEPSFIMGGAVFDLARENKGQLYHTEHRYYGRSIPTPGSTISDLINYLNVDQALADVANFIQTIKSQNPRMASSKVVVLGGSYSASMATWMRQMYPTLVDAAYASSGPLLAVEDYYDYNQVISDTIKKYSRSCWQTVVNGMKHIQELLEFDEGVQYLEEVLYTCDYPFVPSEKNKWALFQQISGTFAGIIQYAKPGDISSQCRGLLSKPGEDVEKLIAHVREVYGTNCIPSYEELRAQSYIGEARSWLFQQCNEFGFFQTSNSEAQMFGQTIPVKFYQSLCKDTFGYIPKNIKDGIDRTNQLYEGQQLNVTKVVSINGNEDPWYPIALVEPVNSLTPTILINGASHCVDLSSIQPSDSWEVKQAKETAKKYIASWIRQ